MLFAVGDSTAVVGSTAVVASTAVVDSTVVVSALLVGRYSRSLRSHGDLYSYLRGVVEIILFIFAYFDAKSEGLGIRIFL